MYQKLDITIDTTALKNALEKTDLWDKYPFRRLRNSPHKEMVDIYVRFMNLQPYLRTGDSSLLGKPHKSIWYESEIATLVKPIAKKIMDHVNGKQLGGILITKLPPNKQIYPHRDYGWHAEYYDKYYVCIKDGGSRFIFEDGEINPTENDVWKFNNQQTHSVVNANKERFAMIVCIKGKG